MILLTPWPLVLSNPLQRVKVLSRDSEGARNTRAMVKSPQAMPRDSPDGDLTHSVLRRDQTFGFAHLATLLGWQCRLNTNSLCYCMVKRPKEGSQSVEINVSKWKVLGLCGNKVICTVPNLEWDPIWSKKGPKGDPRLEPLKYKKSWHIEIFWKLNLDEEKTVLFLLLSIKTNINLNNNS